ncbi:MAG: HPr(Ser) kinase/phosphatase, partial [Mariprofundaceae bacterium]|nr:HPr(Ser) kinase/phosphatase [Mariprofundaceae bacterium]
WESLKEDDRVMSEDDMVRIHKVDLPRVRVPIRPGRSLAVIIEIATRNQLLKQRGINSNQDFIEALEDRIRHGGETPNAGK